MGYTPAMQGQPYYRYKLLEELSRRQSRNERYSLRRYAQHLGLNAASLSSILKGNRVLPAADAPRIAKKLELTPEQRDEFLQSIQVSRVSLRNLPAAREERSVILRDETHYRIIAEWEHYAVLNLLLLENRPSQHQEDWMAERLGITVGRIRIVLGHLLEAGMITVASGAYTRNAGPLSTTEDVLSQALRASHAENMDLALKALDDVAIELRDFSSITVPTDSARLPEAKQLIREFRKKLGTLLGVGKPSEVYQVSIQVFPLTKKEVSHEK